MSERCRGILWIEDRLVTIRRVKPGRPAYYVLPGGGREAGESREACLVREFAEEIGVRVRPLERIARLPFGDGMEYFYRCAHAGGEIGTGHGEEWRGDGGGVKGGYAIRLVPVPDLPALPLLPGEILAAILRRISEDQKS